MNEPNHFWIWIPFELSTSSQFEKITSLTKEEPSNLISLITAGYFERAVQNTSKL